MTAEAVDSPVSLRTAYTAQPPSECLNGCEARHDAPRSHDPAQLLCASCVKRLDKWLRGIPDAYTLLPSVVDHGTVPSDPGTKHTKRPDPPAPMRLEVVDLLDTRSERGVLGVVHSWAELVRDHRHDTRPCQCDHARPSHDRHRCTTSGCGCREYRPIDPTVTRECAYLITNLPWCAGQDFARDLYDEIRVLARTLNDTVGEYRPKPVGKCAALRDVPDSTVQVLCGGALVMVKPKPEEGDQRTSVKCLDCGARHEANDGLRELGLIVDSMFRHGRHQEAS